MLDIASNSIPTQFATKVSYSLYDAEGKIVPISGLSKLAQNVIMELMTAQGTIKCYPDYGCDFTVDLIGVSNNLLSLVTQRLNEAIFTITGNINSRARSTMADSELLDVIVVDSISCEGDAVKILLTVAARNSDTTKVTVSIGNE